MTAKSLEDIIEEFDKEYTWFAKGDSGPGGNYPQEWDEGFAASPNDVRRFIKSVYAAALAWGAEGLRANKKAFPSMHVNSNEMYERAAKLMDLAAEQVLLWRKEADGVE